MGDFHNKDGKAKTNKINAYLSDEAYDAFKNGEAISNNGFRAKDGSFFSDQPDFEEIDEFEENSDYNESAEANIKLVVGIGAVVFTAGCIASPHIKRWWGDKAAPRIKRMLFKIIGKEVVQFRDDATEIGLTDGITPDDFSKDIDVVLEEYRENMSSEEAQVHLINITILAALLAEEIRRLSGDCIKEHGEMPDNYLEWQNAMEKLTIQKVTASINLILANNIFLLDEDTSRTFSEILGNSLITDGRFVPIKNDRLKEALSLKSISADKVN